MLSPHLAFIVRGRARPQGSKRLIGRAMVESSSHLRPWRSDVRSAALDAVPDDWDLTLPCTVLCIATFHRPKSHFNVHGLKKSAPLHPITRSVGDSDKLLRAILDSLTEVIYRDDSYVTTASFTKRYTTNEEHEQCEVSIIQHQSTI